MLELKNISKSFVDPKPVVDNLSLKVNTGEVFGFLGLNGAGKTTTVKMIADLLFPDTGKIKIGKFDHTDMAAKQMIGFMPEQPQFYQHLKAYEVVEFAGELFGLEKTTLKAKADRLLNQVGLGESKNLPARKFSKGMHQRLAFAVALVNDPELLILDEPLDGLDPIGRLDFKKLILGLKKQGKTVFFSSHILADVEELCDRVAILHQGKILTIDSPKNLVKKPGQTLEEVFVEKVRTK
ncbi:MAG TPA: ABC transporter ATP-binding protein [Candidatus Saccharimonadales bacterium]|nr:ABC transporter ATP-binding protein [Candidatus Saccharimonadales bacterium]